MLVSLLALVLGGLQAAPPDAETLAARGAKSLERFRAGPVTWTATLAFESGRKIYLDVAADGPRRRVIGATDQNGETAELFRLTERDGFWYVDELGKRTKHRPHEAHFVMQAYAWRALATPRFIIDRGALAGGKCVQSLEKMDVWRVPVEAAERPGLERLRAQIEDLIKQAPEQQRQRLCESRDQVQELLKNGRVFGIQPDTALLATRERPECIIFVTSLQLDAKIDGAVFDVAGGAEWTDRTHELDKSRPDDLVLINHARAWRPGARDMEGDPLVMDVVTGACTRVPLRGPGGTGLCFTASRTRVLLTGNDERDVPALIEVDLKTGENRVLAEGAFGAAALSPDGRTVLAMKMSPTMDVTKARMVFVDLESGKPREVDGDIEMVGIAWLGDGTGLIASRRDAPDPAKDGRRIICRMDLEGRKTDLREGWSSVLLADRKTILFQDRPLGDWFTCDLSGGDVKKLDALKGLAFPSACPDGKRLLMMRQDKQLGPRPVVVRLDMFEKTDVPCEPGLWMLGTWR